MKNKNNSKIFFIAIFVVLGTLIIFNILGDTLTGNAVSRAPAPKAQCNDKIDNDADNTIDYSGYRSFPPDPDCTSAQDNTECGVRCSSTSNCGTNSFGAKYCFNNDVYQDYTSYNCNLPGSCTSYCTNTVTPTSIQDCQATNPDGYCQNGQCYNPTGGIPNSCNDTDGGQVLRVKGTSTGYYNGFSYSKTDYCMTDTSIREYWCVGNLNYEQNFNCQSGETCINGACVSSVNNYCGETDSGFDVITAGTTAGQANSVPFRFSDYCPTSTTLTEYYCNAGAYYQNTVSCLGNMSNLCSNGACI